MWTLEMKIESGRSAHIDTYYNYYLKVRPLNEVKLMQADTFTFITYRKAKWPAYIFEKLTSQDILKQKDNIECLFAFQTAHLRLSTSSRVQLFKCHFSNSKRSVVLERVAGHRISTVEKQSAILQGLTEILGRTI